VAVDLARGQVAAGHRVLAISLGPGPDGPEAQRFREVGAETHRIGRRARGVDPAALVCLARLLARERVTVVHTHNPLALVYGAPAGRLARAAVVHTKHGANPAPRRQRWLRRLAAVLAETFVAVSAETARVAEQGHECEPRKLRVIPNGVDIERFRRDEASRRELRQELGISADAWVIGSVGRLAPEKDHALLLRAAAPLLSERCQLVVCGDGSELGRLQELAGALAVSRFVRLLGARTDVGRVLSAFDAFALSSRTEGLPLVVPEAMAAGLPVIATAVGGLPAVVEDGVTGRLVPPGDVEALRGALRELASDPARARRMGEAGRHAADRRFSGQRMVDDYLALYEGAAARRAS
jgi:glycosyltransferase involved in cell wall biosynthesis